MARSNIPMVINLRQNKKAFKEECVFEFGYVVESEVRIVDGKERRAQKKTPISYVLAPAPDNQGNG